MEETERIERARRGDGGALAELLHAHYPFILKYLTKITLNPHLAEDLTQETMIRCIHKIGAYNGKTKFSTWLITIGTRLYIDEWRRMRRERAWQAEESALRKIKWQAAQAGDEWPGVLDALAGLSAEIRTAVVLKHYFGFSIAEIAEMGEVPEGTVKSRIHNGIKACEGSCSLMESNERLERKMAEGLNKLDEWFPPAAPGLAEMRRLVESRQKERRRLLLRDLALLWTIGTAAVTGMIFGLAEIPILTVAAQICAAIGFPILLLIKFERQANIKR